MWKKYLDAYLIIGIISAVILINSSPALSFNCAMTADPDTGTLPMTVQFSISVENDQLTSVKAFWDFDDGNTSSMPYPLLKTHEYTSTGTYNPTYMITSDQGESICSATVTVKEDQIEPPEVTLETDLAQGYAPLEVTFTPEVVNGTKPYSFEYSFGDGQTSSGNEVPQDGILTHTYEKSGSFTAKVTVTDSENLSDFSNANITVEPAEEMEIEIESDSVEGMTPFNVKLSSSVTNGSEPYSYVWVIDGKSTSSQTLSTYSYSFNQPGDHTVYLKVTDSLGATAVSDRLTLTALSLLDLEFEIVNASGYAPLSTEFFVNINEGEPPFEISYDFGDGTSTTVNERSQTHKYTSVGTYTATVLVTDGYGSQKEQTFSIEVIDSLDENTIENELESITVQVQSAQDPGSLPEIIDLGNMTVRNSLRPTHNAPEDTKNKIRSLIETKTESLVSNVNNRLTTFENQGTADSGNGQEIKNKLKELITEIAKNNVALTSQSIAEIQSISASVLRLAINEVLSGQGLSQSEIDEIRTNKEKAKTYFYNNPRMLLAVLEASGMTFDVPHTPDRSHVDSLAKGQGVPDSDLYQVQSAIPKVVDSTTPVRKGKITGQDDSIGDLLVEMVNSQASSAKKVFGLKNSSPKIAGTDQDIVQNRTVDEISGNLNLRVYGTNLGLAVNEFSIGPDYLPNRIQLMPDGSIIGSHNKFNFRLYPAPADSLSVINQIIKTFGMTPKFDKTGRLKVKYADGYISLGTGWNIMNKASVSKTTPRLKSLTRYSASSEGVSFSGTGGTDTAAYAYSVLVEYGDGSSQKMPPMIMAEQELLEALESAFSESSISIDRDTGVLTIDDLNLKPDYLFEPVTEIDYSRIENNNGYILNNLAFEFGDYNNDSNIDVKFFSTDPMGCQLLYSAVGKN